MSSHSSVSVDATEYNTAPDTNAADRSSNTPTIRQSSTHSNAAQEPQSSNASQLPAYSRNAPLDDPFRDGDAPVRCNNNGMQKGHRPATTTCTDPSPNRVNHVPPVPNTNANACAGGVILEERRLPPLPPRPAGLKRGLQIPSRVGRITWGFSFPYLLVEHGVTKEQWRFFAHELKNFARMTFSQRLSAAAWEVFVGYFTTPVVGQWNSEA